MQLTDNCTLVEPKMFFFLDTFENDLLLRDSLRYPIVCRSSLTTTTTASDIETKI